MNDMGDGVRGANSAKSAEVRVSHEARFLSEDRAAIFSSAIGFARLALQNGEAAKALAYLDEACDDVDARWRAALVKDGHDAALIERFLGPAHLASSASALTPGRLGRLVS